MALSISGTWTVQMGGRTTCLRLASVAHGNGFVQYFQQRMVRIAPRKHSNAFLEIRHWVPAITVTVTVTTVVTNGSAPECVIVTVVQGSLVQGHGEAAAWISFRLFGCHGNVCLFCLFALCVCLFVCLFD
jgi:hypothetical protein